MLYREATPIERHRVNRRDVFVKRDDLYGIHPAPPLAKLRGLRLVLARLHEEGERLVGCWDTRVSKLGQGVAAAVREFPEMCAIVSYPTRKGAGIPAAIELAAGMGAEVFTMRGNRINICFSQARRHVEERGGVMLPFGLECEEAVQGVAREAARTPRPLAAGTVVLSSGSGVTLAGLLAGLPAMPRRIVGVSSGRSPDKIMACVRRHLGRIPAELEILPASMPYSETPEFDCPFPTHPNYDLKAWKHLIENLRAWEDPVLFWNIGA